MSNANPTKNMMLHWTDFDSDKESLEECRDRRLMTMPRLTSVQLDALVQLTRAVWDGCLLSKQARSDLIDMGLVTKWNGWQVITREGLAVLETLKMLPTKYSSKC